MVEHDSSEPMRFTGFLLRRAQQVHAAVWAHEVSTDITSVQYGVLAVLDRLPGASQRELGDELDLDRSTIADLALRLEKRGHIDRHSHETDRRRNALWLTAAGSNELLRLRPHVERVEALLTQNLDPMERRELRRLLQTMLATPSIVDGTR